MRLPPPFGLRALGIAAVASLALSSGPSVSAQTPPGPWPQWGGPSRNFIVDAAGLAEKWPEAGPPVLWSRPLGTGHSSIVFDEGRLFTMYRAGNGRARQGPWDAEEVVVALDASTGKTIWEYKYPSRREDFSFGAGPHSTPLVAGDRLFTIGTNQQLFAFDKRTGKVLWSHDLIEEFDSPELLIRPVVKTGYGCSPIAYRDLVICSVGGPGQSVMAFRQSDGAVAWKSGDFLTSAAAPILIDFEGTDQVVFLAGGTITALDPATGAILWSHPHDPGNDLNCGTPIWGGDDILFVSSAYKAGSRAIRLKQVDGTTQTEELWFTNRVRFMFLNAVRIGDHVYGTSGDFGPAFLTALDVRTGEPAWRHRGFGRASLVHADGKLIILDEDGDLAIARVSPDGVAVLAEARIFDTTAWTVPTLVGTTLFARDREKIVALDLGAPEARRVTASMRSSGAADPGATAESKTSNAAAKSAPPPAMLAGTWRLDAAGSTIDDAAGLVGLIGAGAPPMLHVTQPVNGTVIVESPVNEGHARIYHPGSKTTTPAGQGGSVTIDARWDGRTLRGQGTVVSPSGDAVALEEAYSANADGRELRVDVAVSGARRGTSALRYVRITDVGPCETWPTPCKRAP